jgi:hypothetical protein
VVLSGTPGQPKRIASDNVKLPVNESRGAQLATFRKDMQALLTKHHVTKAAFKTAEGNTRSGDMERSEVEGVFQEACFSNEPSVEADSMVKSQLRKALSYEGKAKDVFAVFEEHDSLFEGLGKTKYDEAAVTALAGLA